MTGIVTAVTVASAGVNAYSDKKGRDASKKATQAGINAQTTAEALAREEQLNAYNEVAPGLGQFLSPQQAQSFGIENAQVADQNSALQQLRASSGVLGQEAQQGFYDNFQQDPGTQYLRDQGMDQINNQYSMRGGRGGGSRLKAISEFNQNLANQQLGARKNELGQLAQTDIGLGSSLANLRTGLGNANAQSLQNVGQQQAAGAIAQGNNQQQYYQSLGNTFNQAVGAGLGAYQQSQQPPKPSI